MNKKIFILATLTAGVIGVLFAMTMKKNNSNFSNSESESANIKVILQRMNEQEENMRMLEQNIHALTRQISSGRNPEIVTSKSEQIQSQHDISTDDVIEGEELSPEELVQRQNKEVLKQSVEAIRNIEERISSEGVSSDWAYSSEEKIFETFSGLELDGAEIKDVSCTDTVCRVEVSKLSGENVARFMDEAMSNPPIDVSSAYIPPPTNGIEDGKMMVYYSRKDSPPLL